MNNEYLDLEDDIDNTYGLRDDLGISEASKKYYFEQECEEKGVVITKEETKLNPYFNVDSKENSNFKKKVKMK